MKSRQRRRLRLTLTWLFSIALLAALVAARGYWLINSVIKPAVPLTTGCTAVLESKKYPLALDQSANASLIASVADQRGLPPRAVTIAIAVAMQESKLRNISHGDMDSVGMFQQRPSQGWGSVEQILDPVYATNKFFDHLIKVPNYQGMSITDAGQAVQLSAYPLAYGQHEPMARAYASALTGYSTASLSCTMNAPKKPGDPAATQQAVSAAFGLQNVGIQGGSVRVPVQTESDSGIGGWAIAQWAVANAEELAISEVTFSGQSWKRDNNDAGANRGWQDRPNAATTEVVITLQAASTSGT